jgi:hypothetical protein
MGNLTIRIRVVPVVVMKRVIENGKHIGSASTHKSINSRCKKKLAIRSSIKGMKKLVCRIRAKT